ncbi:MAG: FtsW/RodA/SpoVE family cell cycle protein [Acidobacteria bacterium]|nr:FtsW/RodA/SpoVE family cell cycle protein [Acidobacteriota bacterium]
MAQRLKTDWFLFWTVIALAFFGLVIVFSASLPKTELMHKSSFYFVGKQAALIGAGVVCLMGLKRLDYRKLNRPEWAFGLMGVILTLLVAVYFLDGHHHRWIRVPGVQVQPSELAKPGLAIFLAWFVTRRITAINSRYTMGPAALVIGVLAVLVLAGDMGTMAVMMITVAAVFYVAGLSPRYAAMALAALMLIGVVGIAAKPYRLRRVVHFVDPSYELLAKVDSSGRVKAWLENSMSTRDPNYQARQSVIAVGSGGLFGLGLMHGKQKMLYVPEAHTDFIYSVIGEELGFFGCAGVLAAFMVILWRGLRLFWMAPDDFGRYLALAVTVCLTVQALINISVVLDLGPTKGIPLPLISSGGTSMLSSLISLGLLLSVSERAG